MKSIVKNKIAICTLILVIISVCGLLVYRAFAAEYSRGYEIKVHYYNSNEWEKPYIYYYTNGYEGPSWPGVAMNDDGNGWYSYTIKNFKSMKVLFSDNGANQIPDSGQEGFEVRKECWYCDGRWYDYEPVKTTVHYYNSDDWSQVSMYYYTANSYPVYWPGESMIREDGKWYKKEIWGEQKQRVLFSDDGESQIPGAGQEGFEVSGSMWFKDGIWYKYKPQIQDNPLIGDVNKDGVIDRYDKEILYDYINNLAELDSQALENADVNGDGVADSADLELIESYLNGEIEEFPNNIGKSISHEYTYEYDALNRVTKKMIDDNNYIEYIYDANGNITDINVVGDIQ